MKGIGNSFRTFLLLGVLTVMIMLVGEMVGGRHGLYAAFIIAAVMNFFSYWFSDKVVLALYGAKEADRTGQAELYRLVEALARRADIPMPKVYVMPQESPNAFATGRNPGHAAVAVTEGILRLMSREELEGVLAHELSHVKNRDILVASIAATLAGVIMYLGRMLQFSAFFGGGRSDDDDRGGALGLLVAAVLAPIAALMVQMAISRSREYMADSTGARIAGQPYGLASALEKLSAASRMIPMAANPATQHIFIVKPLSGSGLLNMFSTHPPIEERVRRLRSREYLES